MRTREQALVRQPWLLGAVLAATFVSRLAFGLGMGLDADEATVSHAASRILDGRFPLMESNLGYFGALESYLVAPFVWLFGPTVAATRVAMSLVGVGYVLAMYFLGRALFERRAGGLVLAGVAACFPLFELTWTVKARAGYSETILFAAVLLLLGARLGWGERGANTRRWAALGLVTGVAVWNSVQILVPAAVVGLALLARAPVQGWRQTLRGAAIAAAGLVLGALPWLANLVRQGWSSFDEVPAYRVPVTTAVRGFVHEQLPIFIGTSGRCETDTVTPYIAWLMVGALLAAVLWLRRETLGRLVRGRVTAIEPIDMVLALAPVAVLVVLVGEFNGNACQPRYVLPLAIPLAASAALVLLQPGAWRVVGGLAAVGYLAIAAVTLTRPTVDSRAHTLEGAIVPTGLDRAADEIDDRGVDALYAEYWLARPIQYYGGGDIDVAVYRGPAGFPSAARAVDRHPHPSWLFVSDDPARVRFEDAMRSRGITATVSRFGGLTLYAHLSEPLDPDQAGLTLD